ncbi:MAG: tripartite tricarboxylate transporter substrate binding protein [Comamonas sp.]
MDRMRISNRVGGWVLAVLGCLLAAGVQAQQAEGYPDKAIRMVVPWPAGGAADAVGRAIAQALTAEIGQSVYVENIAGAGGNIGTRQFVRAAPDGYTIFLATSSTNAANPWLYKALGFEPIKDFTPVAAVAAIPSIMVVPANSPFRSPQDVMKQARAEPGRLSYGSGGVGSSSHLAGELFKSVAKIDVAHIPYKGSGPAIVDVMGGQLAYMFDTGAVPYVQGGKVRAIGVASDKRMALFPEVPTFDEVGIPGVRMSAWYGVAAPAATSRQVVAKLNAAINRSLRSGVLTRRLAAIGAEGKGGTPEEFAAFWQAELQRYDGLVKLTGATLEQ